MRKINIVISTGHRNWAIGELAKQLAILLTEFDTRIIEIPQSRRHAKSLAGWLYFPKAEVSIFMQQDLLLEVIKRNWISKSDLVILRYTHNNKPSINYLEAFRLSNRILVENSEMKSEIMKLGIQGEKVSFRPHPIEWRIFNDVKSPRKTRDVIFVSNFYKRKRPDLIFETIKSSPNLKFTIYGKNWNTWDCFPKLKELKNLEYLNFNYKEYPFILARHKVFCSLSDIEGGPVPLLESLTAGLKAVVTDTGYSRDMAQLTKGVHIVPVSPTIEAIQLGLQMAINSPNDDFDTSQFDIAMFVREIKDAITPGTNL